MTISVLIVDDYPVVRDGVRSELEQHSDISVVGEAATGDEGFELAMSLEPDVLLLDIFIPGMKAVKLVQELKLSPKPPHILILTAHDDLENILAMLKAGAEGYLLKDEDPSFIADGIRSMMEGKIWLSKSVEGRIIQYTIQQERIAEESELSGREYEVLELLAHGLGNPEIAERLFIAEGTIRNHIRNIYRKLEVRSRAEAVAYAWQHGLVVASEDKGAR